MTVDLPTHELLWHIKDVMCHNKVRPNPGRMLLGDPLDADTDLLAVWKLLGHMRAEDGEIRLARRIRRAKAAHCSAYLINRIGELKEEAATSFLLIAALFFHTGTQSRRKFKQPTHERLKKALRR